MVPLSCTLDLNTVLSTGSSQRRYRVETWARLWDTGDGIPRAVGRPTTYDLSLR